jgi:uncharacterized NAD-dependent epimerase/dehydratase family protein
MGDVKGEANAKTGFGIRDWCPADVVGQMRLVGCDVDLGVAELTLGQARALGAKSLLIGVAPVGGMLPLEWIQTIVAATELGFDIVSGLHTRLSDVPDILAAARKHGRQLHDVRHSDWIAPVANGKIRTGKRLLTVGTDCALGKKYTALAIARALAQRGIPADFRATGQTGIMIAGEGIALDSMIGDFIAGAAEVLSPNAAHDHWDVIEGQGSLFHPAYAGVTLGLVHGSQPDALVLCHDPTRSHLNEFPDYPIPDIGLAIRRYVEAAQLTNPAVRMVGISLNTSRLPVPRGATILTEMEQKYGLPCFDPLKSNLGKFLDSLLYSPSKDG